MSAYVVTIDGPSGSGKGTLAMQIAEHLGFHVLDSGAIYRLAALKAINDQVDLADEHDVVNAISGMNIDFQSGDELIIPYLDGEDVSNRIRDEKTGDAASRIAMYPLVREALLQVQRDCLKSPGLVADGRDMGTVVFPDAKIKLYLHASAEIRAKRRHKQLIDMGLSANIADLLKEIEERDERDRNRSVSPLVPAEDAIIVDCSTLDREQVVELVLSHIEDVNNNKV